MTDYRIHRGLFYTRNKNQAVIHQLHDDQYFSFQKELPALQRLTYIDIINEKIPVSVHF